MDQSTDRLWRSAQNQMSAGNAMAAAQTLHALLERDPRHAAAHMTLGHIARSRARISASRAAGGGEPTVGPRASLGRCGWPRLHGSAARARYVLVRNLASCARGIQCPV